MSSPASISCTVLQHSFDALVEQIEEVLLEPILVARSIQNNCNMLINSLYPIITNQVDNIENNAIDALGLSKVNDLQDNGFCNALFACQAFKNTIISQSATYLPWLSDSIVSQLSTNYDVFERDICLVGLKNLANAVTNQLMSDSIAKLQQLLQSFTDALRLDELINKYQQILDNSGIFAFLDTLEEYVQCLTSVCDYSKTASNKLDDIRKKLHLNNDNNIDQNSFLDKFNAKNNLLTTRINKIISTCQNRDLTQGFERDKLMSS